MVSDTDKVHKGKINMVNLLYDQRESKSLTKGIHHSGKTYIFG